MREVRLPSGAVQSATDPSNGRLARPAVYPATLDLVDRHRFWRVAGDPLSVFHWIERHPPRGSRITETGSGGRYGTPHEWWVGFSFLATIADAPSETLLAEVAAARGGGAAVRVDAEVVWLFTRPNWERIPAAKLVTITWRDPRRRGEGRLVVNDQTKVARIVSLVNDLPAAQPGTRSCPRAPGAVLSLSFLRSATAPALARVMADGGGCGGVTVTLRGRGAPELKRGPELITRLQSLLKTRF
jgi:hypothetical protein